MQKGEYFYKKMFINIHNNPGFSFGVWMYRTKETGGISA